MCFLDQKKGKIKKKKGIFIINDEVAEFLSSESNPNRFVLDTKAKLPNNISPCPFKTTYIDVLACSSPSSI